MPFPRDCAFGFCQVLKSSSQYLENNQELKENELEIILFADKVLVLSTFEALLSLFLAMVITGSTVCLQASLWVHKSSFRADVITADCSIQFRVEL